MKRYKHLILRLIARIRRYFVVVVEAVKHRDVVRNYAFLLSTEKSLHEKLLELERKNKDEDKQYQRELEIKLETVRKILDYVKTH